MTPGELAARAFRRAPDHPEWTREALGKMQSKKRADPLYGGLGLVGDGLRFACRGCGYCCRGHDGFVFLAGEEAAAIAALLGVETENFLSGFTRRHEGRIALLDDAAGDCWFLGKDGCEIYPARPYQCRSWPFWFRNLRSAEAWELAGRECPGIGQGRLHSIEEILAWLDNSPFLKGKR